MKRLPPTILPPDLLHLRPHAVFIKNEKLPFKRAASLRILIRWLCLNRILDRPALLRPRIGQLWSKPETASRRMRLRQWSDFARRTGIRFTFSSAARGHSHEDASDLTQAFFARFLEKRYLRSVDSSLGKFRTFLLTSMTHFLAQ